MYRRRCSICSMALFKSARATDSDDRSCLSFVGIGGNGAAGASGGRNGDGGTAGAIGLYSSNDNCLPAGTGVHSCVDASVIVDGAGDTAANDAGVGQRAPSGLWNAIDAPGGFDEGSPVNEAKKTAVPILHFCVRTEAAPCSWACLCSSHLLSRSTVPDIRKLFYKDVVVVVVVLESEAPVFRGKDQDSIVAEAEMGAGNDHVDQESGRRADGR